MPCEMAAKPLALIAHEAPRRMFLPVRRIKARCFIRAVIPNLATAPQSHCKEIAFSSKFDTFIGICFCVTAPYSVNAGFKESVPKYRYFGCNLLPVGINCKLGKFD